MEIPDDAERCLLCCGQVDVFAIADCCQHIHCILCLVYYWHQTKPNVVCAICKKRITRFAANDSSVPHGSSRKAAVLRQAFDMEQLMVDVTRDFIVSECDAGTFTMIFNSAQMREMFPSPHFRWFFDEEARKKIPETRLYKTFFRRHGAQRALHPALVMNRTTKYKFVSLVGRARDHTEYTELVATRDGLMWVAIYDRNYKPDAL